MKKTVNAAIGGCSFTINEDAYGLLEEYLESYAADLKENSNLGNALDELEIRIADLLKQRLGAKEVVDLGMVEDVLNQTGPVNFRNNSNRESWEQNDRSRIRKFYRDSDGKKIAGVCSGLALYLGIDETIVRIIFLVAMICGAAGFWIYLVLWIVAPETRTAAEKCELRGIPATAENIRRFSANK